MNARTAKILEDMIARSAVVGAPKVQLTVVSADPPERKFSHQPQRAPIGASSGRNKPRLQYCG